MNDSRPVGGVRSRAAKAGRATRHPAKERTIVGTAERIDMPDWGVKSLRVKIDTGARTSALHVDDIEPLPGGRVRFFVVLHREKRDRRIPVEADVVRVARVRSSSGRAENRYFVSTRVRIGPIEKTIEISLARREPMIFRMLLGRSALTPEFLVDPAHRYLVSPKSPKAAKKALAKKAAKKAAKKKPKPSSDSSEPS